MKLPLIVALACVAGAGFAQTQTRPPLPTTNPKYDKDVDSVDHIVAALYDVISGPAGQKRDWDRMRTLFAPSAVMTAVGRRNDGLSSHRTISVEDYIKLDDPIMMKEGFFEKEIGRSTQQFGEIAQLFSSYETRHGLADKKPWMRGINGIQAIRSNGRWWVVSIFWEDEGNGITLPEEYIGKPGTGGLK
jgi:hypothetical protein